MEGNDLGTYWTNYNVVILEPTLFTAPPLNRRQAFGLKHDFQKVRATRLSQYVMHQDMARWIVQQGYQLNMPTEIWAFGEEWLFDALIERLHSHIGRYISRCMLWDSPEEAAQALTSDPTILTVYDADHDRVDKYWRMRGYRVLEGKAP